MSDEELMQVIPLHLAEFAVGGLHDSRGSGDEQGRMEGAGAGLGHNDVDREGAKTGSISIGPSSNMHMEDHDLLPNR